MIAAVFFDTETGSALEVNGNYTPSLYKSVNATER